VPFDGDEDEELDVDVLAGGEDDDSEHAQKSSGDEPPPAPSPPSPSAKRAHSLLAVAHEQDPELTQMPGAMRAKELPQTWRALSDTGKAEWAARASSATPIAPRGAVARRSREVPHDGAFGNATMFEIARNVGDKKFDGVRVILRQMFVSEYEAVAVQCIAMLKCDQTPKGN
jgi:hypothetical protein